MDGIACIRLTDDDWRAVANYIWDKDGDGFITPDEAADGAQWKYSGLTDNIKLNLAGAKVIDFRQLRVSLAIWDSEFTYSVRSLFYGPGFKDSGYKSFINAKSLELVDMSAATDMSKIERMSFQGCTSLKKVILPPNLVEMTSTCFFGCASLTYVSDIPDSCSSIYSQYAGDVFRNCASLPSLTVGRGITRIGSYFVAGCTSMHSFYIKATTPPILDKDAFRDNPCTIYVPRGSGNAYKTATNWSQYASKIQEYDF